MGRNESNISVQESGIEISSERPKLSDLRALDRLSREIIVKRIKN